MSPESSEPSFIEQARRAQIIEATVATIAEQGLAKASFAKIAARAKISPGLITYHFDTRDRLIAAVAESVHAEADRAMSGGPGEPRGYLDAVRRMVTGFVTFCAAKPEQMIALRQISGQITADPRERRRAELGELTQFITDGQQHGEFGTVDPELSAAVFWSVLTLVPEQVMRRPEAVEQIGRDLTLLLVRGLARPGSRELRRLERAIG